jgi:ribosomal protein L40E
MTCPSCGATNPPKADWCGQCLTRFGAPLAGRKAQAPPAAGVRLSGGDGSTAPPPRPPDLSRTVPVRLVPTAEGRIRRSGSKVEWTCASCDTVNPLENPECRVCGASMLNLFRSPPPPQPVRDARIAAALSVVPGAGLVYARVPADGIARFLLWVWWLGTALALGFRASGLVWVVAGAFGAAAAALWVVSGIDAWRVAKGRRPLAGIKVLGVAATVLCLLLLTGLFAAALQAGPGQPVVPAP